MAYTSKQINEIVNDVLLNIFENVTTVTDANVGSVLRQIVEAISLEIRDLYTQLDQLYDNTRVTTATNDSLEELGRLVGIRRTKGTRATANVTFKRLTPPATDFTIPSGAVITTQPNTGDTQLRFNVSSSTTFYRDITDEEHTFYNGVYDYRLNQRFLYNTDNVSITGTKDSSDYTFTNNSDFAIINNFNDFIVDVDDIVVVDDCDTDDWSVSDEGIAVSTSSDAKQGDYSLNLGKSGTSSLYATYSKSLSSSVSGNGKQLIVWLYFDSDSIINQVNYLHVYAGTNSTVNSYQFKLSRSKLSSGWNKYKFDYTDSNTTINGSPAISSINYIQLQFEFISSSEEVSSGDIKMDFWHFSTITNYEGDIVRFYANGLPDHESTFYSTYEPLSVEVECVSNNIGDEYNVGRNKVMYKITNIPSINTVNNYESFTGGTDTESDDSLRTRIQFASELKGKGTPESIRQAVLGVSGVRSCTVDDLPLQSTTDEVHVYDSSSGKFFLDREVLYLDDDENPTNLTITGTASGSSYTFLYNTDFVTINDVYGIPLSQIQFQQGGTNPDDDTSVYVDYEYEWLGHINVFVAGLENPLPSDVESNVNSAVDDAKPAGIVATVLTPTIISVDISATITPDSDNNYNFSDVKSQVETVITNYIQSLTPGENVYRAKIIELVMNVSGVINIDLTTPGSDVIIATDEIAAVGTITLTGA